MLIKVLNENKISVHYNCNKDIIEFENKFNIYIINYEKYIYPAEFKNYEYKKYFNLSAFAKQFIIQFQNNVLKFNQEEMIKDIIT